jgi:putative transposase
MQHSGDN